MSRLPLGRAALVVLIIGAVLFPLGMVGQQNGGLWENGPGWIGAIGWFGFLISLLVLVLIGAAALARNARSRQTASR